MEGKPVLRWQVVFLLLLIVSPAGFVEADTIAYLSHGKLWVREEGSSRMVSDQWQYLDVKWYKKPTVVAVRAGNIELVNTTDGHRDRLTDLGNIRNVAVLHDRNKAVFTRIVGRDPQALEEGLNIYCYDLYSLDLGNGVVKRIGRLTEAVSIKSLFVLGGSVYYLKCSGNGDHYEAVRTLSLITGKQTTLCENYRYGIDAILSVSPNSMRGHLVAVCRPLWSENSVPQAYSDLLLASIVPQYNPSPPTVLLRLTPSPFQSYHEYVDGSCVLSDGTLVFGLRNEDGRSRLCCVPAQSIAASVIADGYRPDATSE
jgi:hypothetical protein